MRVAPARLAVREVARHPPAVAQADRARRAARRRGPRTRRQRSPLTSSSYSSRQPPARAEQRALDRRLAHPEPVADLAVAQPLELAHDEDVVMGLRQPAERAAEVVERELRVDDRLGRRAACGEPPVVRRAEPLLGVERDLARDAAAAVGVDAGVLRDLVDPRLEGDLALGLAHAPQRRDEHLLRDVLGAAVVADHAAHVRRDPALVAQEQQLEGAVVASPHGLDEVEIIRALIRGSGCDRQGGHDFPIPSDGYPSPPGRIVASGPCDSF